MDIRHETFEVHYAATSTFANFLSDLIAFGHAYLVGEEWLEPQSVVVAVSGYEYSAGDSLVLRLEPDEVIHFQLTDDGEFRIVPHPAKPGLDAILRRGLKMFRGGA